MSIRRARQSLFVTWQKLDIALIVFVELFIIQIIEIQIAFVEESEIPAVDQPTIVLSGAPSAKITIGTESDVHSTREYGGVIDKQAE